jgi:DNA invertase Pin-like site-specific DNA recombinase
LKNSDNIDWNAIRSVKDLFARRIFRGKVSGKDTRSRPEPEKAIDALPTKSVLVLADWDRAQPDERIHITERVHKRGIYVKVLDRSGLDLSTPSGRGILALLAGLAEDQHPPAR